MNRIAGIRVFAQVVAAGSFSAAARQLDVAPSSVSRHINDLEEDLGARLFQRTTRKLSLTEAGQLFHERAQRILTEVDEARLAVAELGSPSGILRVTAPSGIGREVIASALPEFIDRHPGIRVVMSMTDEMVDLVQGRVDVAIRVGQLRDSSLRARRIGVSRRVVCGSPDYLARSGRPETPQDLQRHSCLTWRDHPGHNTWSFKDPDGGRLDVPVTGSFFARSADALVAAAVGGMGLTLLPDWNLGIELRHGQLESVLDRYPSVPEASPVWAVHGYGNHAPPKVQAFITFLADRLG